jgi:hypothetical protein
MAVSLPAVCPTAIFLMEIPAFPVPTTPIISGLSLFATGMEGAGGTSILCPFIIDKENVKMRIGNKLKHIYLYFLRTPSL